MATIWHNCEYRLLCPRFRCWNDVSNDTFRNSSLPFDSKRQLGTSYRRRIRETNRQWKICHRSLPKRYTFHFKSQIYWVSSVSLFLNLLAETCSDCDELEAQLSSIREDLVDSLNAWVVKAVASQLKTNFTATNNPAKPLVVYFRHGIPMLYDGK